MNKVLKKDNKFASQGAIAQPAPINNKSWLSSLLPFEFFNPSPIVTVLRLHGVIGKMGMRGGLTLDSLNDSIEKAFKPSKLAAVCLAINSPGGSPVQSELIAKRIMDLAQEKDVPVYSFIEDVGASGGYWIACAGQEIYSSKSSIVGSIGVVSSGFGFQDAIKKLGVERRLYAQGKNKSVLDPFEEAKPNDIKIIKSIQKNVHEHFINYVKSRRKNRLTQSDEVLFNGEFWTGESAKDFGLIDGIEDMYSFIKKNFGDKVKIEVIKEKESWIRKKMGIEINMDKLVDSVIAQVNSETVLQKFKLF